MPTARQRSHALRLVPHGSGDLSAHLKVVGKYQALFDQASDAILTCHLDGRLDAINQAAEELTGYLKAELDGHSIDTLIPDPKAHRIPHRARPLSTDFFSVPGTYEDIAVRRKDGYVRLVDLSVRHVESSGEKLALALFRDLTEKKQMERELITKHSELRDAYVQLEKKNAELTSMQELLVQAGKMAALGELAAGIAHELNQPLQGIRGYAQELQDLIPEEQRTPETSDCLKEIISSADKMKTIISYLRTHTRKSVEQYEFTDVHGVVEEALKMLKRQLDSRGVIVERRYAESLPKVYANPLQLEQVFINLSTNARDAIEATQRGSGRIVISTRINGKFVEVLFQDDGIGMSDRTKAKAFNPFFTTKEVGKGMGLGLSLSYGMIAKLQGSLLVESEMGKGTTFTVKIPVDYRELA